MSNPRFLRISFVFLATLLLAGVPKPASAIRIFGSKGGSHGGGSRKLGGSHGTGHSIFGHSERSHGGSKMFGGSKSKNAKSFFGGGERGAGKEFSGGSHGRSGEYFSRPSSNFARNSFTGSEGFAAPAAPRTFTRAEAPSVPARSFGNNYNERQPVASPAYRPAPAPTRAYGYAPAEGWRSFGAAGRGYEAKAPRVNADTSRSSGQWHSFGNARNAYGAANNYGYPASTQSRTPAPPPQPFGQRFVPNHFSTNAAPSYSGSSGRSPANVESSRFGAPGFAGNGYGSASVGNSGASGSLIGSSLSLIPNLLGGLLHFGTAALGARMLGIDAVTYAARSLVSWLTSSESNQNGYADGDYGVYQGGYGGGVGYYQVPPATACGPVMTYWQPGWGWITSCVPALYYPSGWNVPAYGASAGSGYGGVNGDYGNPEYGPQN